jgi:AraC-like DNA-binding protein
MAEPIAGTRLAVGCLPDGTVYFAPIGAVVTDGDLVLCHLCGRLQRSVIAHLRGHRWSKADYCAAFGLERGQSLEGTATRKLRATAFSARLLFEPAVRDGSAIGRARARSGSLALDAATAARGRALPEQRRRKAARALAGISQAAVAEANRARAARRVAAIAAGVASRAGYATIGDMVRARIDCGASLAAISREAGLHKDWLSRHLDALDPAAAAAASAAAAAARPAGADARWRPVLSRLGFDDVADYLRGRHGEGHLTVNQIAAEAGMSRHAVLSALRRHELDAQPHAAARHAARTREAAAAAAVGYATMADYVSRRRTDGWTWAAMAAESGQPESWLRRRAQAS